MNKLIILFLLTFVTLSYSAKAQYYPFESQFKCACGNEDSLAFVDAKQKLDKTLSALQKSGEIYMYDVNTYTEKSDAGDTTIFSVVLFELDEEAFTASTKRWEQANPEIADLLKEKSPTRKDERLWDKTVIWPQVKDLSAMVLNVADVDHKPDPTMEYKIVVDFTVFAKEDPNDKDNYKINPEEVNWGLGELGRLINLHVGAGIPAENIKIVAAVHGTSSQSFLSNEAYNEKHKMDNPNIKLLNKLHDAGVEFMLCGQSLGEIEKKDLLPMAKITFTAQTTLSEFQMKGYALKILKND